MDWFELFFNVLPLLIFSLHEVTERPAVFLQDVVKLFRISRFVQVRHIIWLMLFPIRRISAMARSSPVVSGKNTEGLKTLEKQ